MPIVEFSAEVFQWRGPSPFHFLRVPLPQAEVLRASAGSVSYGWGMIPVTAAVSDVTWTTSLWPKESSYLVPLKLAVRRAASLEDGDEVRIVLTTKGDERPDRAALVALVGRLRRGEAGSETEEEELLARFAASVPHPRAIDLVLYPEVEFDDERVAPELIVDRALAWGAQDGV